MNGPQASTALSPKGAALLSAAAATGVASPRPRRPSRQPPARQPRLGEARPWRRSMGRRLLRHPHVHRRRAIGQVGHLLCQGRPAQLLVRPLARSRPVRRRHVAPRARRCRRQADQRLWLDGGRTQGPCAHQLHQRHLPRPGHLEVRGQQRRRRLAGRDSRPRPRVEPDLDRRRLAPPPGHRLLQGHLRSLAGKARPRRLDDTTRRPR